MRSSTDHNPEAYSTSSTTWTLLRPFQDLTGKLSSIPVWGRPLGRMDQVFGPRKSGSCPTSPTMILSVRLKVTPIFSGLRGMGSSFLV
ncbi:hypothetical protein LINGRAHAP2_LOCUS24483 [Linum grandiflorum]